MNIRPDECLKSVNYRGAADLGQYRQITGVIAKALNCHVPIADVCNPKIAELDAQMDGEIDTPALPPQNAAKFDANTACRGGASTLRQKRNTGIQPRLSLRPCGRMGDDDPPALRFHGAYASHYISIFREVMASTKRCPQETAKPSA